MQNSPEFGNGHPHTIAIASKHGLLRSALEIRISRETDLKLIHSIAHEEKLKSALCECSPEISIIDTNIVQGVNGIAELARKHAIIVIDGTFQNTDDQNKIMKKMETDVLVAGAKGYVHKQQDPDDVIVAIRTVLQGRLYFSDIVLHDAVMHNMRTTKTALSRRERQVYELYGSHRAGTIASMLGISVFTVETYLQRIKRKLDIANAEELQCASILDLARQQNDSRSEGGTDAAPEA